MVHPASEQPEVAAHSAIADTFAGRLSPRLVRSSVLRNCDLQRQRHMDHSTFAPYRHRQAAASEDGQHCMVAGKHIGHQVGQILLASDADDVPHEEARDAEPLVVLLDGKGEFGTASRRGRFHREVARATNDYLFVS